MNLCDVCGNAIQISCKTCLFCGCEILHSTQTKKKDFRHKVVNLELGRPDVETALGRMDIAIEDAARTGISVLTLIHGYGSSGKGGVIRSECRKYLEFMRSRGKISDVIPGEVFNKKSGTIKTFLRRFPKMNSDKNLNRGNKGITLVVI